MGALLLSFTGPSITCNSQDKAWVHMEISTKLQAFFIIPRTNYNVLPIIVASLLQLFSLCSPKWENGTIRVMLASVFGAVISVWIQLLLQSPCAVLGLAEMCACKQVTLSAPSRCCQIEEMGKKGSMWNRGRRRTITPEILGIKGGK